MGMFDSVMFKCQDCGEKLEAQSKGGDCILNKYQYGIDDIPQDVLSDINRHTPITCDCGASWTFETGVSLKKV